MYGLEQIWVKVSRVPQRPSKAIVLSPTRVPSCPFPQGLSTSRAESAPMTGNTKTGCLLRWSLIPASYHGNLPGSGGHPSNPPGSHPDPEHTGECVSQCVHVCMGVGVGSQGHLPSGRHLTQVTHLLPIILLRGNITPTFQLRSWVLESFLSTPGILLPPRCIKGSCFWSPLGAALELSEQRGPGGLSEPQSSYPLTVLQPTGCREGSPW